MKIRTVLNAVLWIATAAIVWNKMYGNRNPFKPNEKEKE